MIPPAPTGVWLAPFEATDVRLPIFYPCLWLTLTDLAGYSTAPYASPIAPSPPYPVVLAKFCAPCAISTCF